MSWNVEDSLEEIYMSLNRVDLTISWQDYSEDP